MSDSKSSGGGVGFFTLLGILFIGLKLTGYIGWSWWLVTLPIWGSMAALLLVLFIIVLLAK